MIALHNIRNWITKHRTRLALALLMPTVLVFAGTFLVGHVCRSAAAGRMFRSVDNVPQNDVALVLGTARKTARGYANLHFNQRIAAAAKLYHSGKAKHLLVSGDNHIKGYDEPTDMRDELIAAGVPDAAITRDYAGFRTLDSVLRAQSVFGLTNFTIITEEFHCPRALWIARWKNFEFI